MSPISEEVRAIRAENARKAGAANRERGIAKRAEQERQAQAQKELEAKAEDAKIKILESHDKPFLEPEEVPSSRIDWTEVMNLPDRYVARWCNGEEMSDSRRGIWHVLDKNHPEFSDVRVHIDHTKDKSYFSYKGMILCVSRKETVAKKKLAHREKTAKRSEGISKAFMDRENAKFSGESRGSKLYELKNESSFR